MRNPLLRLSLLVPAAVLCATARAQITNQDDCANSGVDNVAPGTYAFDNGVATTGTQGQSEPNCYAFGTSGISNDIWFTYTAAANGMASISTCGSAGTTTDTRIAVYPSGAPCPPNGSSITCNDDGCGAGFFSEVVFPVAAGTPYIVQLGNFPSTSGGTGDVTISEMGPPTAPVTIVDSVAGSFIDISATGTPLNLSDDGEVDIPTTVGNSLLAAGTARVGSNGAVRFDGAGLELAYTNQPIPSGGAFAGDQTLMGFWDDWNTAGGTSGNIYWEEIGGTLIVQWDNAAFFASADTGTFQIQVHSSGPAFAQYVYEDILQPRPAGGASATIGYQAGGIQNDFQWSFDTASVSDGTVLSIVPAGPVPIGTNYCGPAIPNSTGGPGVISAIGSVNVGANDVTLTADGLPPAQFGYFLNSMSQGMFVPPGSNGFICLSGAIGRHNQPGLVGTGPTFSILVDLSALPTPSGFVPVLPGDVYNFQCWYRDLGNTNNFTDAIEIQFQ